MTRTEREKRNAAMIRKFNKLYHEGIKKYHLYGLLGKEFGLDTERVAELIRPRRWGINGGKFKSRADQLEYFRERRKKSSEVD